MKPKNIPMISRKMILWVLTIVLCVGGIMSLNLIPFIDKPFLYSFDFYNLFTYQNCEFRNQVYEPIKFDCGDDRGMVYPPLLYYSFAWTRGLEFYRAAGIWSICIILLTTIALLFFNSFRRSWAYLVGPLLFVQFASVFALERGNNDAQILFIWALAAYLSVKNFRNWSLFLMALATMSKIYPLVACFLVLGAWGLSQKALIADRLLPLHQVWSLLKDGMRFKNPDLVKIALSCVVLFFIFPRDSWLYFTQVLPHWSGQVIKPVIYSHSIQSLGKSVGIPGSLFILAGVYIFLNHARFFARERQDILYASSILFSSFVPGVAYDYSLILSFPLLFILFKEALESSKLIKSREYVLFVTGVLFVLGYRNLWVNHLWNLAGWHILAQLIWLYFVIRNYSGAHIKGQLIPIEIPIKS